MNFKQLKSKALSKEKKLQCPQVQNFQSLETEVTAFNQR